MSTTEAKIREAQLRAACGLGGPRELSDYQNAEFAGDREEIAAALGNLLPDVQETFLTTDGQRVPAVNAPDGWDPRDPRHQRTRSEWVDFAAAERNFAEDNHDYVSRVKATRLPDWINRFIVSERLPALAYYLAARESAGLVRWLESLSPHEQREELQRLAHELVYGNRIPQKQRGISRPGDMQTDANISYRASD
jgi:hypothetical protein